MRLPEVASSLRGYRREWLTPDLVAAATLLVIAVPEQLATARLAGMPPVSGYYTFVAGSLVFALLGSNRQLSVGADSTIAPLFAGAVAGFATTDPNSYPTLVGILAILVGLLVAAVWLFRLAWVSEFLSAPIITGFLAGIAVVIVVDQLPALLGVSSGGDTTIGRLQHVWHQLGAAHIAPVAIGLGVFAVVLLMDRVSRRFPGALVALVLSTAAVAVFDLQDHGVAVIGQLAGSGPHLGLTDLSLSSIEQLAPIAGIVALVVVTQSAATTRAFARQGGYSVDVGADLLAVGAGSIAAGLTGGFPVDASPPRTAAIAEAGGRTQVTGIVASLLLLALLPATALLHDVPLAALAGVLLFIATRIFHVSELRQIARFNLIQFGLAVVTLLTVAFAGVEEGIGVAIALAILERTRISARPQLHVLGRIPGTTSWAPLSTAEGAEQVPGVLVVLFATPLWYANAVNFREEVKAALERSDILAPIDVLVLDALGMSDVDYTGLGAFTDVLDHLDHRGITFGLARAGQHVRDELTRAGVVPARVPEERLFPAVDEAVVALHG